MALVTMKEMLADARARHYCVAAFDVSNYEMARNVVDVAAEERSPVILMALKNDLDNGGLKYLSAICKIAAESVDVPVAVHLDHAVDFDLIKDVIDAGFTSVMFDGSTLPFEENAEKTREVVKLAHSYGATVEAELGHGGNAMVGNENDSVKNEDPEDTLTVPEEVVRFREITDVDALAIAIGTAHGVYLKTPTLRIDRLDEITAVSDLPLMLHGGSGTPDDQMQEAIKHGITKINIFSDVVGAMNLGLKNKLNTMENPSTWPAFVFEEARARMKEAVRNKILVFGSKDRV